MRLPRVRLTVRRLMVLVLVLGVAAHLAITAWRVDRWTRRFGNLHVHTGIIDMDPMPSWASSLERRPFWPSYGRALLGMSWQKWTPGRTWCRSHDHWLAESCELADPAVRGNTTADRIEVVHTKQQKDVFIALARKKGLDARYDEKGNVVQGGLKPRRGPNGPP